MTWRATSSSPYLEETPEGRFSNSATSFYTANVVCALEYLHR